MEGRRKSLCVIFIKASCVILLLAFGLVGFYLKSDYFNEKSDNSTDEISRVQRQVVYNEEPTSPPPNTVHPSFKLKDIEQTLDKATLFLKHGPQFIVDFGARLFDSEISRVLGAHNNIIPKRAEPESNVFSVVKRTN